MCKKFILFVLVFGVIAGTASVASAQIITGLVRTGSTNTAPAIAGPFGEEVPCFTDRTHEYEVLPPELPDLVGAEYIRTANDDKGDSTLTHEVTISQMARIYLILDNRLGASGGGQGVDPDLSGMPWVATMGFTDTGYDIGIDESADGDIDQWSSLFVNVFSAGTVVLQGSEEGHGGNMYGIVVTPPPMVARNPSPPDGSTIDGYLYVDNIYVVLTFAPGYDAQEHEVFFSEFESLVTALDPSVSLGAAPDPLNPTTYYAGVPLPEWTPYTDSLVRGTTYYWRAVEYDSNGVDWPGPVWSFYVALDNASNPRPADNMINVGYTPTLRWGAGAKEIYNAPHVHQVYFGTTWADVNSASEGGPLHRATLPWDDTDWEPNSNGGLPPLDPNTDYYWRIDEKHGTFGPTVKKGDVWTFKTVPEFPIGDPNLINWWRLNEGIGPTAVDRSGYGHHGDIFGATWTSPGFGSDWCLEFGGDGDYAVDEDAELYLNGLSAITVAMWIKSDVINTDRGFIDGEEPEGSDDVICMRYDSAGATYGGDDVFKMGITVAIDDVNTSTQQLESSSLVQTTDWQHAAMTWSSGQVIKFYINGVEDIPAGADPGATGTITGVTKLIIGKGPKDEGAAAGWDGLIDDVKIFDYALTASEIVRAAAPPEAWSPNPSDGTVLDPSDYVQFEVTWKSGADAAQHLVYWGTSPGSLTLVATKPRAEPNYAPPGGIEFETTYYWQIVETNNPSWPGPIWSFSTVREAGHGSILGEGWTNITGTDLNNLKSDPNFVGNVPDISYEVPSFDSGTNLGDNYGGRIHGLLIPDTTGDYRFWICTDDQGELWLNRYGADPSAAELIAFVKNPPFATSGTGYAPPYNWWPQNNNNHPEADSNNVVGLIHLEADQEYYICGLWKEGGGGDHCQVAWMGPDQPNLPVDGSGDAIIDGYYLKPFSRLWASNPKPRYSELISADEVTRLGWLAGVEAAGHRLWFDDDPNVTDAPLIYAELPLAANSVNPSNYGVTIEWEKTYWWKVTEFNDANIWDGSLWWFRTTNYAIVENFEPYNKTGPSSGDPNALRYKWKDGFSTYPVVGSGSNVMLASTRDEYPRPYLHWDDYSEGEQGLVFYFDNDGNTYVPGYYDWQGYGYQAPKYSETSALTSGAGGLGIGQDWTRQDIKALSLWFKGNPMRTGSFQENVPIFGKYTMIADGADIWDVGPAGGPFHDEFHYAYQSLVKTTNWLGAGTITVRVESVENTDAWAKAGIMMRASLFPDANHVMAVITPGQGVSLQFRDQKRGVSTNRQRTGPTAPHWLRLVRDSSWGNFEAYHANDVSGAPGTWYALPDADNYTVSTVGVDPNIYVGLCLTSHNASAMCTSVFSDLTITPATGSALMGPWQDRDIGILSNEPNNPAEPMYLALEDLLHNVAVRYHDDPNAALIETWTQWNIDLQDFVGINPSLRLDLIDKVHIGFGNRVTPTTGGSGCVYFDDIRLYRSRFVPGYYGPDGEPMPGNIDDPNLPDGVVDGKDLSVMAGYWLESDGFIPTSPPAVPPGAHYEFEGDATDSVSIYDGTVYGSPTYETGKIGSYAISLGADSNDYIIVQDHAGVEFTGESFSVALWVNSDYTANPKEFLICNGTNGSEFNAGGYNGGPASGKRYVLKFDGGEFRFLIDDDVTKTNCNVAAGDYATNDWVHCVAVCDRDANELRLYRNGVPHATTTDVITLDINSPAEPLFIGAKQQEDANASDPTLAPVDHFFRGMLDDVRIYNYVLTDAEAAYLADVDAYPEGLYVPMAPAAEIANIYDFEAAGLRAVNFRDYAVLALDWLKEEPYWP